MRDKEYEALRVIPHDDASILCQMLVKLVPLIPFGGISDYQKKFLLDMLKRYGGAGRIMKITGEELDILRDMAFQWWIKP